MTTLLALALLGCDAPDEASDAPVAEPATYGWISAVVLEPSRFTTLTEVDRDGWIALHARRYAEAAAQLDPPVARARAAWHLVVLHEDLSRLTGHVYDQLFRDWAERGLPEGSAAPVVAALAARCTGVGDPERWSALAATAPGHEVLGAPLAEVVLPEGHPWSARAALHRSAADDPGPLLQVAPAIVEPADGFERRFYDPCVHAALYRSWESRLAADLGGADWRAAIVWAGDDLTGHLFAPWLAPDDLRGDLARVGRPGLVGSGGGIASRLPALHGPDVVQPARDLVHQLDAELADAGRSLAAAASADGTALLTDLALLDRHRQDLLVVRAREALLDGRPQQALVLLQLARDATAAEAGPRNAPELFALLAEAELRTGRVREALDALHDLAAAHPEVRALEEVAGDLAVLRGLDRRGDSREE